MHNSDLLARFEALPDLLLLARQKSQNGGDAYAIQEQLLIASRSARHSCRTAMPYRHMFHCQLCGYSAPEIEYRAHLFTAANHEYCFEIRDSDVHAIRNHRAEFPGEFATALSLPHTP